MDINVIVNFYKKMLEEALVNNQEIEKFNNIVSFTIQIQEKFYNDIFKNFFEIVLGYYSSNDLPNMTKMFFPQRFLNLEHLDEQRELILYDIVKKCFYLGLMYHFLFRSFPTRENIDTVDLVELSNKWCPYTLIADFTMKEYSKEYDGLAETYFNIFYNEQNFKTIIKDNLKVAFLKRGRMYSFFKNIFYCGAMFGMCYYMETK
jgi:hypothetical protein